MRYIDADALIDYLQYNLGLLGKPDVEKEPIAHGCYIVLEDMLMRILTTHTADVVEVRHGEWILMKTEGYMDGSYSSKLCCSLCGREINVCHEGYDVSSYAEGMYPYCHCGAKMDGGVAE